MPQVVIVETPVMAKQMVYDEVAGAWVAVKASSGVGSEVVVTNTSLTVDGAVSVSNFPVTQPVSGAVEIQGFNGTSNRTAELDEITRALVFLDYAHHEVHEGDSFYFNENLALGNGASQDYLFTTPNSAKRAHWGYEFDAIDAGVTLNIYEASDRAGTTLQTVFNRDRNSISANTTTLHKGVSGGTTDGTNIGTRRAGARTIGRQFGTSGERILKENTKYIVRLTNLSTATNNVWVEFNWYEHTNKTA